MRKGKKTNTLSTFLGPDSSIEGTIEFQNTIRLDGNVVGKISSNGGTVIIGEKAVINAEIKPSFSISARAMWALFGFESLIE